MKSLISIILAHTQIVVPLAGTWIEIGTTFSPSSGTQTVVPLAGTWIEI